jgi:hypothetical protein
VVSNVKINDKRKEKEYDPRMWEMLWKLPYSIAVIPRHPFPFWFLNWVNIPENITIINEIWVLKSLCTNTSLVVMWLIFSNPEWEMDHSPLEATINSNAISWYYDKVEDAYQDFYNNFWLIHRYKSFENSMPNIPNLINDTELQKKLKRKQLWIEQNKNKYLKEILDILLHSN